MFYENVKRECKESVDRALSLLKDKGHEVIGVYGSGARYICMPKGDFDVNVIEEGKYRKTTYSSDEDSVSILKIDEDTNGWYSYPSTKESFLPIGAVVALHGRCLNERCRTIVKKVVGDLSLEDRRDIGKSMINTAVKFAEKAERGKDLVRAFCDFLPYGRFWRDNPEKIPSVDDNTIENVASEKELSLCVRALKQKHGSDLEERMRLRDEGLKEISENREELEEAWERVKKKMVEAGAFGGIKSLEEL